MAGRPPTILICPGENTMPLDTASIQRGRRGAKVLTARQPCRAELGEFRAAAAAGQPRVTDFPVVKGAIRSAKGHLGAFEVTVDDYAQPAPSSRGKLVFSASRDGAVSHCDLVLDLSGGAPLFTASDLREGYLRADPGDGAAVLTAVLAARDLVRTFDSPRYLGFTREPCVRSPT